MSEPSADGGSEAARRERGIAAYSSQFGLSPEETVAYMDGLLGEHMAAEAQHAAASAWRTDGPLSRRDRSLIVIASLVTQGGVDARLRGHIRWAPENGLGAAELEEMMALLAVYVGYPKAAGGMDAVREELAPPDAGD